MRLDGDVHLPRAGRRDVRRLRRRGRRARRSTARPLGRRPRTAGSPCPTSPARQRPASSRRVQADTADGRGRAQGRRPGRRRGLPLDVVRARRGPVRLGLLRPARPQGAARVHRHRARPAWTVRQQLRRPAVVERRGRPAAGPSPTRRRCRRTTRSSTPARSTRSAARPAATTWACSPAGRWRPSSTATPTRSSPLTEQGLGVLRRGRSGCRSRSASTTRSSCPSSAARWRTTAASPGRTSSCAGSTPTPAERELLAQVPAARDGAHVVRQHRHDALVGRPVAQRGVRRVRLPTGPPARATAYTDAWAGAPRRRQARRLPRRPGPDLAPDPPADPRRRRGRVDLRRDHLPQGRLGAAAAHDVRRRGRRSRPA